MAVIAEKIETYGAGLQNNVWLLGDNREMILIDASHDAEAIYSRIAKYISNTTRLKAILCTHGHYDHINAILGLSKKLGGEIKVLLHPSDNFLWEKVNNNYPTSDLAHGQIFKVGDEELIILHTPGHTPGSVCIYRETSGELFTGDTFFPGGPGATSAPYSDFNKIINSIVTKIFILPESTIINPGHGMSTTLDKEKPHLGEWIERGW
jgi:glyoxylase-like metal-dependent hydrolase (beta-lactamase superfamily II)